MPRPDEQTLRSAQFRRERSGSWKELQSMVDAVERSGMGALDAFRVTRLPVLYRAALSSLSVARSISLDRALLEYLEALAGRAYFCVYGPRRSAGPAVGEFLSTRFPSLVRRYAAHFGLACALLLLGTATGFAMVSADPDAFYGIVPNGLGVGHSPANTTADLRAGLYSGPADGGMLAAFAAQLLSHNSGVGFVAFALGFAAGVPTIALLFYNGMILGAVSAVYHGRGLAPDFWGWVLPHGVTELTAIALCGAAGLILAESVVFPGVRTRLDNLALRGRDAGLVAFGAVLLFLAAALLEGFFRQLVTDIGVRYAVVGVSTALLIAYFTTTGRMRS